MVEVVKQVLESQYLAALAMLKWCIVACAEEHWEGKIANDTFREIAYHTLFFAEFYAGPGESAFELREVHRRGGDEREPVLSPGLSRQESLAYVEECRERIVRAVSAETEATLRGPSGFSGRECSRMELHVYNIRHVQHHTGAMAAYLRRVEPALRNREALRWVGHGWR